MKNKYRIWKKPKLSNQPIPLEVCSLRFSPQSEHYERAPVKFSISADNAGGWTCLQCLLFIYDVGSYMTFWDFEKILMFVCSYMKMYIEKPRLRGGIRIESCTVSRILARIVWKFGFTGFWGRLRFHKNFKKIRRQKKYFFFRVQNFFRPLFRKKNRTFFRNLKNIGIFKNKKINFFLNSNFEFKKSCFICIFENSYIFQISKNVGFFSRKKCAKFFWTRKKYFLSAKNFEIFVESQNTWKPRKSKFSAQSSHSPEIGDHKHPATLGLSRYTSSFSVTSIIF